MMEFIAELERKVRNVDFSLARRRRAAAGR